MILAVLCIGVLGFKVIAPSDEDGIYEIGITDFEGEEQIYTADSGKEMPFKVAGIMAVPKGEEKFPLLLIVHGSHDNINEENRFDTGYEYLAASLAQKGYVVIGLDVSKAYIWKYGDNDDNEKIRAITAEHLKSLKKAAEGDKSCYPISLKNKIDFNKIGLIGHSRGGETILDIADDISGVEGKVEAILAVAPTFSFSEKKRPDCDVAVVVPEYDGDVVGLDGFQMYDAFKNSGSEYFNALVMLLKANHNYFNQNIQVNDTKMLGEGYEDQLTPGQQKEFLSQYAVDFFEAAIRGKITDTVFDVTKASVNSLYGYPVQTLYRSPTWESVVHVKQYNPLKDAWFYQYDEIQGFQSPLGGTKEEGFKELIPINWTTTGYHTTFATTNEKFSHKSSLVLEIAVDASHENSRKSQISNKNLQVFAGDESISTVGQDQGFTICLVDSEGKKAEVEVAQGTSALRYVNGKMDATEIEGELYYYWNRMTPLTNLRIPLEEFAGINLNKVKQIEIICNITESGAILIESIGTE